MPVEGAAGIDHAVASDHGRLDHLAGIEFDDQGNDTGVRKIDFVDNRADIGRRHAGLELDNLQMREKGRIGAFR